MSKKRKWSETSERVLWLALLDAEEAARDEKHLDAHNVAGWLRKRLFLEYGANLDELAPVGNEFFHALREKEQKKRERLEEAMKRPLHMPPESDE